MPSNKIKDLKLTIAICSCHIYSNQYMETIIACDLEIRGIFLYLDTAIY